MFDMDRDRITTLFERIIPFNRFLGMKLHTLEEGLVILELPFREEFIGNPEVPALHGGVVSTLLDSAGGAAVWSSVGTHDRVSTVDLRVDYLRPGRPETLLGRAEVVRAGNRVGVAALRAYHPGAEDRPIAAGMGVYNVRKLGKDQPGDLWDRGER